MSHNQVNAYDLDRHVAEIYDLHETKLDDVGLICRLLGKSQPIRILEPFCGTGRILFPLALEGHTLHGIDQSSAMLGRASLKIEQAAFEVQGRVTLSHADVLHTDWPADFDLVVLGCNCFYELATPDEQKFCIASASQALKRGGYLFIDNDHMEGDLAPSWQDVGVIHPSLCGTCSDGTIVKGTRETLWFDAPNRLVRFRRRTQVILPTGEVMEQEYVQQKHPVSKREVQIWLEQYGFVIENIFGDYTGIPYTDSAPRAIFWARRV